MRDEQSRYGQPPALPVPLTYQEFCGLLARITKQDGEPPAELLLPAERITELLASLPIAEVVGSCNAFPPPGVVAVIAGVKLRSIVRRGQTIFIGPNSWPSPPRQA